jgi:hypothetical protein
MRCKAERSEVAFSEVRTNTTCLLGAHKKKIVIVSYEYDTLLKMIVVVIFF